jgi:hypothetical protein
LAVYCTSLPVVQGLFSFPLFIGYGTAGSRVINRIRRTSRACSLASSRVGLEHPGNMLSAAIAYQVLRQENPPTIEKIKAALEKHPRCAKQWQARLQDVPAADHGLVLFMQAARWADDVSCEGQATPPGAVALHQLAV